MNRTVVKWKSQLAKDIEPGPESCLGKTILFFLSSFPFMKTKVLF